MNQILNPPWTKRWHERCLRYGLAVMCIAAPLFFGWASEFVLAAFVTRPIPAHLLSYEIRPTARSLGASRTEPSCAVPSAGASTAAPAQAGSGDDGRISTAHLVALQLAGEFKFATISAFRYLVAIAAIAFGVVVLYRRVGPHALAGFIVGSLAVAVLGGWWLGAHSTAALLLARPILSWADDGLLQNLRPIWVHDTGALVSAVEVVNYTIGMLGVGMVFCALFAASIRDLRHAPRRDELEGRLTTIRIGLILTSAALVVVALSNRILLDWSLSLLTCAQQDALRPLSEAIVTQWAACGTMAVFGTVLPALVAWRLDVVRYRAAHPGAQGTEGAGSDKLWRDGFQLVPVNVIASVATALAPLLASPIVDVLKTVMGAFGRG